MPADTVDQQVQGVPPGLIAEPLTTTSSKVKGVPPGLIAEPLNAPQPSPMQSSHEAMDVSRSNQPFSAADTQKYQAHPQKVEGVPPGLNAEPIAQKSLSTPLIDSLRQSGFMTPQQKLYQSTIAQGYTPEQAKQRQQEYNYAITHGMNQGRAEEFAYSLQFDKTPPVQLSTLERQNLYESAKQKAEDFKSGKVQNLESHYLGETIFTAPNEETYRKNIDPESYARNYVEAYSYARSKGWDEGKAQEYATSDAVSQWMTRAGEEVTPYWHNFKSTLLGWIPGVSKPEERAENPYFATNQQMRNIQFHKYHEASWLDKHFGKAAGSLDAGVGNVVDSLASPGMLALAIASRGESVLTRGGLEAAAEAEGANAATRMLARASRAGGEALARGIPSSITKEEALAAAERAEGALRAIREARVPISVQRTARTFSKLAQAGFAVQMTQGTVESAGQALETAFPKNGKGNSALAIEYAVESLVNGLMATGLAHHLEADAKLTSDLNAKSAEVYENKRFGDLNDQQQAVVINKLVEDDPRYQNAADASEKQAKKTARKMNLRYNEALQKAWNPDASSRAIKDIQRTREDEDAYGQIHQEIKRRSKDIAGEEKVAATRSESPEAREARRDRRKEEAYRRAERQADRTRSADVVARSREDNFKRRKYLEQEESASQGVKRRSEETEVDAEGHKSFVGDFWGEKNFFGVMTDGEGHSVYRKSADGTIEWMDRDGNFSEAPENLYFNADPNEAETLARITALSKTADSSAEQEDATREQKEEADEIASIRRSLLDGEISAEQAQKAAGIAEAPKLTGEYEAARDGRLNGPYFESSPQKYFNGLSSQAEEEGMEPEEIEALLEQAQTLARTQTESNLNHIAQPGDYIDSKKGTRWVLDANGMLHPDDGGRPVPLMKGGVYSNQAMQLAASGNAGYGTRTLEELRRDAARDRKIADELANDEAREEMRKAYQMSEVEPSPETLPREDEAQKARRRKRLGIPEPPPPTEPLGMERPVRFGFKRPEVRESVIHRVAEENGVSDEEAMRVFVANDPAWANTIEQMVASLKPGDEITDPMRPGRPWKVEYWLNGKLWMRSGQASPIGFDPLNPIERVKGIVSRGEVKKGAIPPEPETSFDPPYVTRQKDLSDEVNERATKAVSDPPPQNEREAQGQIRAAEERKEAAVAEAIRKGVEATNVTAETTESEIEEKIRSAEEARRTAEEAAAQEAKRVAAAKARGMFQQYAPVYVERLGNPVTITQGMEEHPAHYGLVKIKSLILSHFWDGNRLYKNNAYTPEGMQKRTFDEDNTPTLISEATPERFRVADYLQDYNGPERGVSIVENGGRVVGGNTRLLRIMRYLDNLRRSGEDGDVGIALFHDSMRQFAKRVGIDNYPDTGEDYVVVRLLDNPIETNEKAIALGELLNSKTSAQVNEGVQAVTHGRYLNEANEREKLAGENGILAEIGKELAKEGVSTVRAAIDQNPVWFAKVAKDYFHIPDAENSEWFENSDKGQVLTLKGKDKFELALISTHMPNVEAVRKILNTKAATALSRSIGTITALKAYPDRDLTGKVSEAVQALLETERFRRYHEDGTPGDKPGVAWNKAYGNMALSGFGVDPPPEPDMITRAIYQALLDPKTTRLNVALKDMIVGEPGMGLLIAPEVEGKQLTKPSEFFNVAFEPELKEIARQQGTEKIEITQNEFEASLKNRELSDQETKTAQRIEGGGERRRSENAAQRKRIDQMSREEAQEYIKRSRITGLPSAEDFEDHNNLELGGTPAPVIGVSDMTGLKVFNETYGEKAGNKLLKAMGDALRKVGVEAYHIHGDEIAYRANDEGTLRDKLEEARRILQDAPIEVTAKNGKPVTYKGVDFSYGMGSDYDSADKAMTEAKKLRSAKRGEFGEIKPVEGGAKKELVKPPSAPTEADRADRKIAVEKQEQGYVTPAQLKEFLGSHPGTKNHASELMRTARMMAEYVYDTDPPVGVDRKDALAWILEERVARLEKGTLKSKRGEYSDPAVEKGIGTKIMKLHQSADPTTFIHEFSHVVFPFLSDDDLRAIDTIGRRRVWDGNPSSLRGESYAALSEKLAHGLEQFLRDENPAGFTEGVKEVLRKVKQIMRKVYLGFKNDPLSPFKNTEESREVFAKMFGITEFNVADEWREEVKEARAAEKKLRRPEEEPHPLVRMKNEYHAAEIQPAVTGAIEDSIGDRIDPKKPIAVFIYPTKIDAVSEAHKMLKKPSKITGAEFIPMEDGRYGVRVNTPYKFPTAELNQEMPRIERARTAEGKLKMGADAAALGKILGSSLYGSESSKVITKELVQNAMDAVRGLRGEGSVWVDVNEDDNSISVRDSGPGMTKHELETVFTDLGSSGKRESAEASGGFGLAKAAPLMMSKNIEVSTVVKEGEKFYRHRFEATPNDLLGEGVDIHSEEVEPQPTGTVVKATLAPNSPMWQAENFLQESGRSISPPGKLVATRNGRPMSIHDIAKVSEKPIVTTKIPGSTLRIFSSKEKDRIASSFGAMKVEVHNNGIFQFNDHIDAPEGTRNLPHRIVVDVRASVPEGDPDYPFQANREALRGKTKQEIDKEIKEKIINPAVEAHVELIGKVYHSLPKMKTGEEIPILDAGGRLRPEELKEIQSDPAVIAVAKAIHRLTFRAIDELKNMEIDRWGERGIGQKVKRVGIIFSDDVHGVYIGDPKDRSSASIFINPFAKATEDPRWSASLIWHTIRHELVHDRVKGHNESFTVAEAKVARELGRIEIDALTELARAYAEPAGGRTLFDDANTIRPDLDRAIQLYKESRERSESTPDILGGESLHTEMDNARRASNRGTGVPDRRKGALPKRDLSTLFQQAPQPHPGRVLEDLEKRLQETPEFKIMERKLLQVRIDNLKNKIRADHGLEEYRPETNPDLANSALQEVKSEGRNAVRETTHGIPRAFEPRKVTGISKPPKLGMPGHAASAAERGRAGRVKVAREPASLDEVKPVNLLPLSKERGTPVGTVQGEPFDQKAWIEGLKKAGLPENAPAPTVPLSQAVADKLRYPGQKQAVQIALSALQQGDGVVLANATGTGKCLGRGTLVLMFDGSVLPVEAIKVGDELMGPDSTPRKVLSLAHGWDQMYKIIPTKGDPYTVNEPHILSLKMTPTGTKWPGGQSRIVNISILDYLKQNRTFKHRAKGYRVGVNFSRRRLPMDPYILGMWLGDGTSTVTGITTMDPEIRGFWEEHVESLGGWINPNDGQGRCPTYNAVFSNLGDKHTEQNRNVIKDALRGLSLIGNKHIPLIYKANSERNRLELLAGLIDTDGSLNDGGYEITQKRKVLADDIAYVARSLGFAAYVSACQKTCVNNGTVGTYHRVYISGEVGRIPCRIWRKRAEVRKQKKDVLVTGIKVDPVGIGEYFGFEIDGDRLFLLGDFTVTHNTYLATGLIKEFQDLDPNQKILYITKNKTLKEKSKNVALNTFGFEIETDAPKDPAQTGVWAVSYVGLMNDAIYRQMDWDLVLADESGEARNWFQEKNQQGKRLKEVMAKSKKGVYLSATPFHSPMEYGYLDKLNLWPKGGFDKWIQDNFAHEKIGDRIVARLDPSKQAKLRQQLIERGQLVSQAISYEGFNAHFGVVPVTDAMKRGLDRISEGFARAQSQLIRMGKKGAAQKAAAFEATYTKAFLERERLPQAIELVKKAIGQGWQVLVFSEHSAEDLFRRQRSADIEPSTYQELDDAMGGTLSKIIPPFPDAYDSLRAEFGTRIGDYSGRGNTMAERKAALLAFQKGETPILYSTYAAGGIGVDMHDADFPEQDIKGGDKPRVSIYLGPPYSGVLLEQAMGRTWRFGVKSDAHSVFLATDSEPDLRLMTQKVGPRMRALRAAVLGERDSLAQAMASYNDEEKVRARQDALAYSEGDEEKVNAARFRVRSKSRVVGVQDWSAIEFPSAETAKNKGMRYGEEISGGDWSTLFQARFGIQPPESPEERAAKKVINDIGNAVSSGRDVPPELQNLDPAARDTVVGMAAATSVRDAKSPVDRDRTAAARMSMESEMRNSSFIPYQGLTLTQELGMENIARLEGLPKVGLDLKLMNRGFRADQDVIRGKYWTKMEKIFADNGLKTDDKTVRDVSFVLEGKRATTDARIQNVANGMSALFKEALGEAVKAGVLLKLANGENLPYSMAWADPKYFPHRIDWKYEIVDPATGETKTLREVMKPNFPEEQRERMLRSIPELKPYSYQQVLNYLYGNNPRSPSKSHINFAREINFPFYRRDYSTLLGYFDQLAQSVSAAKNFGAQDEKLNWEIDKLRTPAARKAMKSMFRSVLEPQGWDDWTGKAYSAAVAYEAASKMTFSAFKLPGHLLLAPLALDGRVMPFLKGAVQLALHPKDTMENAAMAGAITRQMSAADMLYGEHTSPVVRSILKKELFEWTYKMDRVIGAAGARVYLEQYAMNELRKGGEQAKHTRRILRETFLIGDKEIDEAVKQGRFSPESLSRGQTAFVNLTLFSDDPLQMPALARQEISGADPQWTRNIKRAVRLTYSLQAFSIKAASFLREKLYDEMVIHHNLRMLPYVVLASPIAGEALLFTTQGVKHGVQTAFESALGKKHKEDSFDRHFAELMKVVKDRDAVGALKEYIDAVTAGWGIEMVKTVALPLIDLATGTVKKSDQYWFPDILQHLAGPFWSDVYKTGEEIDNLFKIKMGKRNPWQKGKRYRKSIRGYIISQVPALRNVPELNK